MTKLGIQISSLREYLQTPEDVLESFKKVSEIGYESIQIQWINPEISKEFIHEALGVEYAFAEQETFDEEPFECLTESYEYLVKNGIK